MAALEGYNISFKIGDKVLAGRTQDDLTIAARTKESLTKDDAGATQVAVSGHDITFHDQGSVFVKPEMLLGNRYFYIGSVQVIIAFPAVIDRAAITVGFKIDRLSADGLGYGLPAVIP